MRSSVATVAHGRSSARVSVAAGNGGGGRQLSQRGWGKTCGVQRRCLGASRREGRGQAGRCHGDGNGRTGTQLPGCLMKRTKAVAAGLGWAKGKWATWA